MDAYQEGFKDYVGLNEKTNNPYKEYTSEYYRYLDGYNNAIRSYFNFTKPTDEESDFIYFND